jgi:hypothetical protein
LFKKIFKIKPELVDSVFIFIPQTKVKEGVIEGTTHKKLQREIVSAFWRLAGVVNLGIIPVNLEIGL